MEAGRTRSEGEGSQRLRGYRQRAVALLDVAVDLVYYAIAVLLLGGILHLLAGFVAAVGTAVIRREAVPFFSLVDQLLLILLLLAILHTVHVSLGERHFSLHPFLVVGIITSIRQLLKLSLEMPELLRDDPRRFALVLAEGALHGALILVLVCSIWLLSRTRERE